MPVRKASAKWNGELQSGNGTISIAQGTFEQPYSFGSRFQEAPGTNPEELVGAALAGCFSMALAGSLGKAGFKSESVHTKSSVTVEKIGDGFVITRIDLATEASVPGIEKAAFLEIAQATKKGCPVSKALTGTDIYLDAVLV